MKQEFVTVRNLSTGRVGKVRRRIAEHEVFGRNLEIVPEDTKSRIPLSELAPMKFDASEEPTYNYEIDKEDLDG